MAKAYWIAFYRSIKNPDALAAYAKLAGPAVQAAGGRFCRAGGMPAKVYEGGAQSAHGGDRVRQRAGGDRRARQPRLQGSAHRRSATNSVERELRIVEGVA